MPSLFSRLKGRDSKKKKNSKLDALTQQLPTGKRWEDASARKSVEPEEIQELIRRCTEELKARALDMPFLLLPFRPASDPSAVRTFIRHYFDDHNLRGETLIQELRMTEPMVISGIVKWCWSRLFGGIVGWDAYELFKVGEQDSNMARDSFKTFIPLSVDNGAKSCIIFDFFDLLSAIAAHGKMNGMGGRKLSRMAAWWAFEQKDTGKGFDGGYQAWQKAADATSHLFFAYLRSLSPQQARGGITMLPMSLQKLLQETEYPPERPSLLQSSTSRVLMHVDTVSPTPFALLRRANHFQYHDEDRALQAYSEYEDPVKALTEECRRVLKAVSAANQSNVSSSKHSTSLRDASWSRFEDIGFASALEEEDEDDEAMPQKSPGLRTMPASGNGLGRPTTPSWADFLSTGFVDDSRQGPTNVLLPPDKVLPPIETTRRQRSSQSHRPRLEHDRTLEPGDLASITKFDLDDAFWWVWMSSLAPEETAERKSAFGRCAVIETSIRGGRWLVMEEMVVGAAPEPQEGAYIAEKKGFFSWTRRNKGISRRKSTGKQALDKGGKQLSQMQTLGLSKTSIGPDQHARIQAAAAQLQAKQNQERMQQKATTTPQRRGRTDTELMQEKTNSIMTLQPAILNEASQAMKWASKYDKDAIRETYLTDSTAGRGHGYSTTSLIATANGTNVNGTNGYHAPPAAPPKPRELSQPAQPAPQLQITQAQPRFPSTLDQPLSEKSLEAPADVHPAERSEPTGRMSPLPPPPPQDAESMELARENMVSPEPGSSPDEKKHKKLHKDKAPGGAGLRKLFGRKNRTSRLPENAAANLNGMLQEDEERKDTVTPSPAPTPSGASTPALASASIASPVSAPSHTESALPTPTPANAYASPMEHQDETTPTPTPRPRQPEPTYDPSPDAVSPVDTEDAREARQEFSRFDQGPLMEQPAFVPEDSDSDDAVPPPIARRKESSPTPASAPVPDPSIEDLTKVQPVPAQDRWAQIRKNAAERAAQRQATDVSRPDGDDDTSGEETIESRVARIKARVAELTGNMEGVQAGGPPPRR